MNIEDYNLRSMTYRTIFQLWSNFSTTWIENVSEPLTLVLEFEEEQRDISYLGPHDKIHGDILKLLKDNYEEITKHLSAIIPEHKQGEKLLSNSSSAVLFLTGEQEVPQLDKTAIAGKVVAKPYVEPSPLEYLSVIKKNYGY